jgi:hypothetical protein
MYLKRPSYIRANETTLTALKCGILACFITTVCSQVLLSLGLSLMGHCVVQGHIEASNPFHLNTFLFSLVFFCFYFPSLQELLKIHSNVLLVHFSLIMLSAVQLGRTNRGQK